MADVNIFTIGKKEIKLEFLKVSYRLNKSFIFFLQSEQPHIYLVFAYIYQIIN